MIIDSYLPSEAPVSMRYNTRHVPNIVLNHIYYEIQIQYAKLDTFQTYNTRAIIIGIV